MISDKYIMQFYFISFGDNTERKNRNRLKGENNLFSNIWNVL